MIGVKRNTGFTGILSRIKIHVNGKEVAKIKEIQQIELYLPADEVKIYVSKAGSYSNELVVNDGQVVEITNSFWLHLNYLVTLTGFFLATLFLPHNYRIIGYVLLFITTIALSSFKNSFDFKVIYP